MCICSVCCLQFRLEKSGIFSVWRVVTLSELVVINLGTGTVNIGSLADHVDELQ